MVSEIVAKVANRPSFSQIASTITVSAIAIIAWPITTPPGRAILSLNGSLTRIESTETCSIRRFRSHIQGSKLPPGKSCACAVSRVKNPMPSPC